MTANKPMTSEQLEELMTIAVNMQRDSEKVSDRPAAMFAYAVQKAVLELRKVRNEAAALAAENAGLKNAITAVSKTSEECEINGDELKYVVEPSDFDALTDLLDETPATNAFLAEVRAQGVEMLREHPAIKLCSLIHVCDEFAAQLRKGVQS
ncbi:eae-like domain protein [Enterobacter hormaechei subsp. hoffmannii]|nr:eae-like domain protein [Enterobacter hormaechei subsp. hoffmannii]